MRRLIQKWSNHFIRLGNHTHEEFSNFRTMTCLIHESDIFKNTCAELMAFIVFELLLKMDPRTWRPGHHGRYTDDTEGEYDKQVSVA